MSLVANAIPLTDKEFKLISALVYDKAGIKLSDQKHTLIVERLQKIIRNGGFGTFKEYYDYVVSEPTGTALLTMIDKISTHHTMFFREKEHFEFMRSHVLPHIVNSFSRKVDRNIRIWCAGCSSGEEPYTLAMLLHDYFAEKMIGYDIGILATDISVSSIEKARNGIYPSSILSSVPIQFRNKYFKKIDEENVQVVQSLREMILFRRLNLIRENYPFRGLFQVIFCRNVMIYFDTPTRQSLVERYHRYLEPEGFLFIGHSESISRANSLFKYVKPAVYQKI